MANPRVGEGDDDDDESGSPAMDGSFQRADADEMKKRRIVRGVRRKKVTTGDSV